MVRVTPVGAMTYARFYGRSLPLMAQWWLAVQTGHDQTSLVGTAPYSQPKKREWNGMWMMQEQSIRSEQLSNPPEPGIQTVSKTTVNNAGIQGLEQNVNEWTMTFTPDGTLKFHIHGGIGELDDKESYLERQPWEAFSRVGFRTVLNLSGEK